VGGGGVSFKWGSKQSGEHVGWERVTWRQWLGLGQLEIPLDLESGR
jgi:hypothetical protein